MRAKNKKRALLPGIALLLMLLINYLGARGLINGMSQQAVSEKYPTLITPAPYAFSIWSVIYVLLLLSVILLVARGIRKGWTEKEQQISRTFFVSAIFNAAWIISFSFEQMWLSVIWIFFMTAILLRLVRLAKNVPTKGVHHLYAWTFALYGGWVFIATVVNIAAALVSIDFHGVIVPTTVWAAMTLLVAAGLLFLIGRVVDHPGFYLGPIWAMVGIIYGLQMKPNEPFLFLVALAAMVVIGILGLALIRCLYQRRFWFRK